MPKTPATRLAILLCALGMAGCTATATVNSLPEQADLKRLDALGACQERQGAVWSYTSSEAVHSWHEAAAFVARLNSEQYLGATDWQLPMAADLDRVHDTLERKRQGDCEVDSRLFLFVADEHKPIRYQTSLVGCGVDYRKDVNQAGVGYVRAIRWPR